MSAYQYYANVYRCYVSVINELTSSIYYTKKFVCIHIHIMHAYLIKRFSCELNHFTRHCILSKDKKINVKKNIILSLFFLSDHRHDRLTFSSGKEQNLLCSVYGNSNISYSIS